MICEKCGANITKGMKFCSQCGAKVNIPTKMTEREILEGQERLQILDDFDARKTPKMLSEDTIARHEEATQAPLISFLGLLSTEGRRGRLMTLKMIIIQMVAFAMFFGIFGLLSRFGGLILFYIIAFWVETTTVFKRLHDLDKPNLVGVLVSIVSVISCGVDFMVKMDPRILLYNSLMARVYGVLTISMLVVFIYLLVAPGTKGKNRYGRSFEELKHILK